MERFVPPPGADPSLVEISRVTDLNAPPQSFEPISEPGRLLAAGQTVRITRDIDSVVLPSPQGLLGRENSVTLLVSSSQTGLRVLCPGATVVGARITSSGEFRFTPDGESMWLGVFISGHQIEDGSIENAQLADMLPRTVKCNPDGALTLPPVDMQCASTGHGRVLGQLSSAPGLGFPRMDAMIADSANGNYDWTGVNTWTRMGLLCWRAEFSLNMNGSLTSITPGAVNVVKLDPNTGGAVTLHGMVASANGQMVYLINTGGTVAEAITIPFNSASAPAGATFLTKNNASFVLPIRCGALCYYDGTPGSGAWYLSHF